MKTQTHVDPKEINTLLTGCNNEAEKANRMVNLREEKVMMKPLSLRPRKSVVRVKTQKPKSVSKFGIGNYL